MKRSTAVIIFNEESDERHKLKEILDTFYCLNMTLNVLVNKTADEIQEAIVELTKLDPENILDIIIMIYAKQVNESDREFSTVDRKIMNIYDNIINFLLEVMDFEDKQKIIIFNASGQDNQSDLVKKDPEKDFMCVSYGSKTSILLTREEKFIEKIFPELVKHRNITRAMQKHNTLKVMETISYTGDLKLAAASSSSELTSEFHEFVIG